MNSFKPERLSLSKAKHFAIKLDFIPALREIFMMFVDTVVGSADKKRISTGLPDYACYFLKLIIISITDSCVFVAKNFS